MKIKQEFININDNNRSGKKLLSVEKIVVHFVDNPGTSARANVGYIDGLDDSLTRYASAHYFVGDIETIQIIPDNERAFHVGSKSYTPFGLSISSYPNARTLGVEFCHPDAIGKPSAITRARLVDLLAHLCVKHHKNPLKDICTHFDITGLKANGKTCPKYYVENPVEFDDLKYDVLERMEEL